MVQSHHGAAIELMRWIAKALLAAGFLTGIYGVTEPNEMATRSGLGLIVAGVLAMVYGIIRRVLESRSPPGE